jgi:pilus assembly protein Flp/PilA
VCRSGQGSIRHVNRQSDSLTVKESQMKNMFARFVREEAGQDLIEYGLLVGLITVGTVTLIGPIGSKVTGWFQSLSTAIGA